MSVYSGTYSISFESSCQLVLGYILETNQNDLSNLRNFVPNTFSIISKSSTYYYSGYIYTFTEPTRVVLFNNASTACYASTFSTKVEVNSLSISAISLTLPKGVTKAYSITGYYDSVVLKSSAIGTITINYYPQKTSTNPTSTPPSNLYLSKTIYSGSSERISLSSSTSYIYLQCASTSGCPVRLSLESSGSDSGSSTIIGAIIGPIVFVVIFVFIVIISVVSTIFARRRRMLLLAAATTAVATSSTTTHNYVPVPTPVSTTTTTTEKTTVYVPPPVTTTAQQPYIQPGVPQPYNPNYGNQAYYSQPPPTTGQPYQPQPYTQPYAQPYTSQPYTPQPYQNQPPPPYYNPGVGVAQQEPMPAFNPNVDRV